jgi:class 3 adenylate cyclase
VRFTDLVGSTATAAELGDRRWRELLERQHAAVRSQLARFRGHEVDTAGDGFFATFDGPARAIRCARAVTDAVGELALEVRAGLHTGECELLADKVAGIAVSIGARVAAQAGPGEVLVSRTAKDLVAGSGIQFADRGTAELRGAGRMAALRGGAGRRDTVNARRSATPKRSWRGSSVKATPQARSFDFERQELRLYERLCA